MSSVMNVIPEGPGSVSPRMKHRWTRVRTGAGRSSTQWPGFSAVPWTEGSGFDSLGPMYATSRPRTSRYHSIAFRGSETTIAIVSTPRTVMRIELESEIRAMNLSVSGRRASALRRPASVHLRVPFHDLVVRDPVDLLLHRELVLRLPGLHDPPGGGFALELRDEELPFSAAGFERRDHLGAVEDDVAGPHVELVDNRFAQVKKQVVEGSEHELPSEFSLLDFVEAVLHRPHHGPLPAGEEAFHQPSLRLELPQSQAGLPHVVLESGVSGEILFRAVCPVLRDREAFREETAAVKPVEWAELPHAETRREIGAQAAEGLGRGDRIGEPGVEGNPLPRQREGEEIFGIEVPRHDGTVGQEIGESDEARSSPVGEVFRLRDVLRLKSRDSQDVDAAHRVEPHHPREGRNRVVQQIRRGEIHFADLDASAHLPDLRHADEVAILDEGEEPTFPVAARDLGPESLRPRIEQGQDAHRIRTRLSRDLPEGRETRREDEHLPLPLPRHPDPRDNSR